MEDGKMEKDMVQEYVNTKMAMNMKANGKMTL